MSSDLPSKRRRAPSTRPTPALGPDVRLAVHRTPTEHIDSAVVDESEHHPLDAPDEEGGQEEGDEGGSGISSTRTARLDGAGAGDVEKGLRGGMGVDKANSRHSQKSESEIDPAVRDWKDDIVSNLFAGCICTSLLINLHPQKSSNKITFDSKSDPANPKNFPYREKMRITMLYGLCTMCSTFASSVFSSASKYIQNEFGISQEVAILGISLFVLG